MLAQRLLDSCPREWLSSFGRSHSGCRWNKSAPSVGSIHEENCFYSLDELYKKKLSPRSRRMLHPRVTSRHPHQRPPPPDLPAWVTSRNSDPITPGEDSILCPINIDLSSLIVFVTNLNLSLKYRLLLIALVVGIAFKIHFRGSQVKLPSKVVVAYDNVQPKNESCL